MYRRDPDRPTTYTASARSGSSPRNTEPRGSGRTARSDRSACVAALGRAPRCRRATTDTGAGMPMTMGMNRISSSGRVRACRFARAPDDHAPRAAREVLQHQQGRGSQRQADEKHVAPDVGAVKLIGIEESADDAEDAAPPRRRSGSASASRACRASRSGGMAKERWSSCGRHYFAPPLASSARSAGGTSFTRSMLAQLQRAHIGHDGPTVARLDLRGVIRHGAQSIGDHIEEVSDGSLPQAIDVVGLRWRMIDSRAGRSCRGRFPGGRGRASSRC